MINVHSHILYGVDDGSENLEQSIDMLNECAKQGITDLVLTPHYRGAFKQSYQKLKEKFDEFSLVVKEQNLNINLYLGQEITYRDSFFDLYKAGEFGGINGGRYVLIEFDFHKSIDYSNVMHEIKLMNLVPIIAHPERYDHFTLADACEIRQIGGMIQVNAESIVGKNRHRYKKLINAMFKEGLVDIVAGDEHYSRPILMEKAYKHVLKHFGEDAAKVTFYINAKKVIKG